MNHEPQRPQPIEITVSEEALHKAEEFIEAEEGAANKFKGWLAVLVTLAAFVMSVFHLYTAYAIVPTQTLRPVHVGFVLSPCFLIFPLAPRVRHRARGWDWLGAPVVEAMRRTNGWIMPLVTTAFIAYALLGPLLPAPWTHKGYEVGRLI